jgi:hypothetical protein
MRLSADLFKERLVAALELPHEDLSRQRKTRWTAQSVSEYLRARLDTEQPAESGSD